MGRRKYSDGDYELLDKLKHENKKLKKQISALRKQIAKLDIDRYENLKELVDKHNEQDLEEQKIKEEEFLNKKWQCHECHEGVLKLKILERRDGIWYYRSCNLCKNRTKLKRYNSEVEGIK